MDDVVMRPVLTGKPRGVVFDLDGTLVDTERISERVWAEAEAATGVRLPEGFYARLIGLSGKESRRLLEALSEELDTLRLLEEAGERYHAAIAEGEIPLKPGVEALLDWAAAQGWPMAVATSSQREQAEMKLARTGLRGRFQHVTGGDEVEHAKPDPEIYRRSAALLGLPPGACLAVEDSPNGLLAATGAGIPTVLVPDLAEVPKAVAARALRIDESLLATRQWLEGLV